jgi:sulfite exporter TauE/SafE
MIKILISLFLLGLSFGSGPCLASCGPILISYIVGTKKDIGKGVVSYILFSLARIAVYIILGLCVFLLGRFVLMRFVGEVAKYLVVAGGAFIILIGALMIIGKSWNLEFCNFLHKHMVQRDKKSVMVLGVVIGLLPCAPLAALFSYVGLISKTWAQSLLYSLSFGLGTALSPLILLVILAGSIPGFLTGRKEIYSQVLRIIAGAITVILGAHLIWKGL